MLLANSLLLLLPLVLHPITGQQLHANHAPAQPPQYQGQPLKPVKIKSLSDFYGVAQDQVHGRGPADQPPPIPEDSVYIVMVEKAKELRYGTPGDPALDDAEALKIFEEVAYAPKAGPEKAQALHEAALVYTTGGKGVAQDLAMAVNRMSAAAQLGYAEAKHTLAFFLATGVGNRNADDATAVTFEAPAAEGGSIGGNLAMGFRYLYGAGVEANLTAALLHYKATAEITVDKNNHYPGLVLRKDRDLISLMESRNAHGKSDAALRTQWLKEAASGKNVEALFEVAKMYDTGAYGMEEDQNQAFDFFLAAAQQGHPGAMAQLGLIYAMAGQEEVDEDGRPVPSSLLAQDMDTAVDWLEKAGALGEPAALNALAYMYRMGKGVDMDEGKAQELYKTAAEAGQPEALFAWAELCLAAGEYEDALTALHQGEEAGNVYASFRLAQLYQEGLDPVFFPASLERAVESYKRVAEAGYWVAGAKYGVDLYKAGQVQQAAMILAMMAEEGYEIAQANAAYLFSHRMGYTFDDADELALRLYERAALQSPDYYYELGSLMLRMEMAGQATTLAAGPVTGVGQAMGYLEAAAEHGDVQALRKLAEMYEAGVDGVVVKNTPRALSLYKRTLTLASAQGGVWASLVDITKLQWKITSLSAKRGFESFIGGSKEEGEKQATATGAARRWDAASSSAREGL